jgi:hypothetical protein
VDKAMADIGCEPRDQLSLVAVEYLEHHAPADSRGKEDWEIQELWSRLGQLPAWERAAVWFRLRNQMYDLLTQIWRAEVESARVDDRGAE